MEKVGIKDNVAEDIVNAILVPFSYEKIKKQERYCDYIFESTGEKISFPGEMRLYEESDELDDFLETKMWYEELMAQLNSLLPRTREILCERLGIDGEEKTLEEIGRRFGLTRERVRQIENKGMLQLRARLRKKKGTNKDPQITDKSSNVSAIQKQAQSENKRKRGRPPKHQKEQ